jgi:IS4 transposase
MLRDIGVKLPVEVGVPHCDEVIEVTRWRGIGRIDFVASCGSRRTPSKI